MKQIADDEIIYRHVPGGERWQAAGPMLTTANFQYRTKLGETGISVTRAGITGPERLLQLVRRTPGSRVVAARVGEVHALGLLVVPVPLDTDPGHAEIRDGAASLNQRLVQKRLANIFRFLDVPGENKDE
jgi:hypothetical protein